MVYRLLFLVICVCLSKEDFSQSTGMGLSFIPDYRFKGSALTGWKPTGPAKWIAQNGEVKATLAASTHAGLLVMDKSYQDAGVHILFKCGPANEAGVLVRLERKADSLKGFLISVKDGEFGSYRVVIDKAGNIIQRDKLRNAGGIIRIAPPPPPPGDSSINRNFNRPPVSADVPLQRPVTTFRPNEWNLLELYIDANMIRAFFNDGGAAGSAIEEGAGGYGPIALYASGAGEVYFKDIFLKDIAVKTLPLEQSSARFRPQQISDMYYSWGCTAGDFNKDGHMDVAAGPLIYFGPDFTKSREVFLAVTTSPGTNFTETNCQYSYDFNYDGWPDILSAYPRCNLYINPKNESRRWDKYMPVGTPIQTEINTFRDLDNDGKPELIYGAEGRIRFAKPDPADPTKPWTVHDISQQGYMLAHGIGVGDINGDGRMDIVNPYGWWEQPSAGATSGLWNYHPVALARYGHRSSGVGGSLMGVFDVNGDGLNDVVTSLNAHGFGLAWYEQKKNNLGIITFIQHIISDDYSAVNAGGVTFSQIHGNAFGDINGDGIIDLVAGKRYWAHLDTYLDPDPHGAPVVYYYRTVRNPKAPGGAEFVPELVHNRSGAGSDMLIIDLNKDNKPDIISSTDRGTFIFWNKGK